MMILICMTSISPRHRPAIIDCRLKSNWAESYSGISFRRRPVIDGTSHETVSVIGLYGPERDQNQPARVDCKDDFLVAIKYKVTTDRRP